MFGLEKTLVFQWFPSVSVVCGAFKRVGIYRLDPLVSTVLCSISENELSEKILILFKCPKSGKTKWECQMGSISENETREFGKGLPLWVNN